MQYGETVFFPLFGGDNRYREYAFIYLMAVVVKQSVNPFYFRTQHLGE